MAQEQSTSKYNVEFTIVELCELYTALLGFREICRYEGMPNFESRINRLYEKIGNVISNIETTK